MSEPVLAATLVLQRLVHKMQLAFYSLCAIPCERADARQALVEGVASAKFVSHRNERLARFERVAAEALSMLDGGREAGEVVSVLEPVLFERARDRMQISRELI